MYTHNCRGQVLVSPPVKCIDTVVLFSCTQQMMLTAYTHCLDCLSLSNYVQVPNNHYTTNTPRESHQVPLIKNAMASDWTILALLPSLNNHHSLTIKVVLWATATWESISSIFWNWLNSLSTFHDERAWDIRTHTLVGHTAIIHSVQHEDRVFRTRIWLVRTLALYGCTC